jgi:hypothetical protein
VSVGGRRPTGVRDDADPVEPVSKDLSRVKSIEGRLRNRAPAPIDESLELTLREEKTK